MLKNILLISFSILFFFMSMFKIPETSPDINTIPLGKPQFKKLIYFVIDGLRFDGYVPCKKKGIYFNNFTFTKDPNILKTTYFSLSSVPTATTCRVTSLMTGAPSNVIEEFLSFFPSGMSIEALPDKFSSRTMKAYGDDMWPKTFKILKDKSSSFCGYSKHNLAMKELKLAEEVIRDKDIDIKFIHTISVDGFGHVHNTIHHKEIQEAQIRADDLINDLFNNMDEDTLLVVTSDHGVTNEGGHGGSSTGELASICGFYSKNNKLISHHTDFNFYNSDFLENFYDLKTNLENDWIASEHPYKIIHQDDILPTICYLMGIPVPFNTYGNLIPYLVNDENAYKLLYEQKMKILSKMKVSEFNTNEQDYVKANYELTKVIFKRAMDRRPVFGVLSALFGLIALFRLISFEILKNQLFTALPFIIAMIMVTHSYWSFASEDIVWAGLFLLTNFSFPNMIFILFFLKTPGRNFFSIDRVDLHISFFKTPFSILSLVGLFFILKNLSYSKSAKNNTTLLHFRWNYEFLQNCVKNIPQFGYILYSLFIPFNYDSKIAFLCIYPSIDTLFTVHFPPTIALIFIYFIKNMNVKISQGTKHVLLAFCPYLLNLEKVQQSINYDIFFTLTKDVEIVSEILALLSYFIVPRYFVHRRFRINSFGMFLNLLSLLFCFACSWVMNCSLVFQYFFVGRLFFVTSFFIIDVLIEGLLLTLRRNG